MRALSVRNPWAWALCVGLKPFENREWRLPQWARGQRVLIHCGARQPMADECDLVEWAADEAGEAMPPWAHGPVGGLVGSLIFDDDVTPEAAGNKWATGSRCWHVREGSAVLFRAAIPCKGALGFFRPPPAVLQRFKGVA